MLLDEVGNANIKTLSSDVVKNAINQLGWNWYKEHENDVLQVLDVPVKLWKLKFSVKHTIRVSDVKFLFSLLFGTKYEVA